MADPMLFSSRYLHCSLSKADLDEFLCGGDTYGSIADGSVGFGFPKPPVLLIGDAIKEAAEGVGFTKAVGESQVTAGDDAVGVGCATAGSGGQLTAGEGVATVGEGDLVVGRVDHALGYGAALANPNDSAAVFGNTLVSSAPWVFDDLATSSAAVSNMCYPCARVNACEKAVRATDGFPSPTETRIDAEGAVVNSAVGGCGLFVAVGEASAKD